MGQSLFDFLQNSDTSISIFYQLLFLNGRAFILLLGCFIVLRVIKNSAANRHFFISAAIACLLLLPLSSQLFPAFDITIDVKEPVISHVLQSATSTLPQAAQSDANVSGIELSYLILVTVYLIGTLYFLLKTLLSNLRMFLLVKLCKPVSEPSWTNILEKRRNELGIKRKVRICHSHLIASPATWGLISPVILIPSSAKEWSDTLIRSTLLHELAHIKRCDWLTQQLARCICALYWITPLAWLAHKKLCDAAEEASDDMAINSGIKKSHYADDLVNVAVQINSSKNYYAAIAMASSQKRSQLSDRVLAILNPDVKHAPINKTYIVCSALAVMFLLLPMASMRANYVERVRVVVSDISAIPAHVGIKIEDVDSAPPSNLQMIEQLISNNNFEQSTVDELRNSLLSSVTTGPFTPAAPVIRTELHEIPASDVIERVKNKLSDTLSGINRKIENNPSNQESVNKKAIAKLAQQDKSEVEKHNIPFKSEQDSKKQDSKEQYSQKQQLLESLDSKLEHSENAEIALASARHENLPEPKKIQIEPHSPQHFVIPKYPSRAQSRGIEGEVTVSYNIDQRGNVVQAEIVSAKPSRVFNRQVLKAIRKSKFNPRKVDGQAVPVSGLTEKYVFILKS